MKRKALQVGCFINNGKLECTSQVYDPSSPDKWSVGWGETVDRLVMKNIPTVTLDKKYHILELRADFSEIRKIFEGKHGKQITCEVKEDPETGKREMICSY